MLLVAIAIMIVVSLPSLLTELTTTPQTAATSGHSALLTGIANKETNDANNRLVRYDGFSVTWVNNTSMFINIVDSPFVGGSDVKDVTNKIYVEFPSTQEANSRFDALRGAYPIKPEVIAYKIGTASVTGHNPTIIKALENGNGGYLTQEDNVLMWVSLSHKTINQA